MKKQNKDEQMKELNLIHQGMTDEEIYQNLRKNKNPVFMSAGEWKRERMKELKKQGLIWSK